MQSFNQPIMPKVNIGAELLMPDADITCPYDHDRDGKVNATDEIICRNSITTMTSDLELITVP